MIQSCSSSWFAILDLPGCSWSFQNKDDKPRSDLLCWNWHYESHLLVVLSIQHSESPIRLYHFRSEADYQINRQPRALGRLFQECRQPLIVVSVSLLFTSSQLSEGVFRCSNWPICIFWARHCYFGFHFGVVAAISSPLSRFLWSNRYLDCVGSGILCSLQTLCQKPAWLRF